MKKLRKLILVGLSLLMCLSGLAACNKDPGYSKEGRLVVWMNVASKNAFTEVAKAYTAETGVEVLIKTFNSLGVKEVLSLDGPSGKGGDIYIQGVGTDLGECTNAGLYTPFDISDVIDPALLVPAARDLFSVEGENYGVPIGLETLAIVYNKDIFPSIPETWSEFETMVKAFNYFDVKSSERKYGLLMDLENPYYNNCFVEAFGGYIFDRNEDGTWNPDKVGINTPETRRGYEFMAGLYGPDDKNKNYVMPKTPVKYDLMLTHFRSGRVGAMLDGPWAIPLHKSNGINVGVAKIPKLDINGGLLQPMTFSGAYGMSISAYSKNIELSKDFMKFYMRNENIIQYYRTVGRIPSTLSANQLDEIKNDDTLTNFIEQYEYSFPQPNIMELNAVWAPLMNAGTSIFNQKNDIATVLAATEQGIYDKLALMRG